MSDAAHLHGVAWPVVESTMRRVASNVRTIVDRLHLLGYRWAAPARINDGARDKDRRRAENPELAARFDAFFDQAEAALVEQRPEFAEAIDEARALAALRDVDEYCYDWALPGPDVEATIEEVELALGPLPLALRGLFRFVDKVDLAGSLPTWDPSAFLFEGPEPWPRFGAFSCPFNLFGAGITLGYVDHVTGQLLDRYRNSDGSYGLYLGGDATGSAGYSGSCHIVQVPGAPIDPLVLGIERGYRSVEPAPPMPLVEYLRWVFDWGGFPGFQAAPHVPPEIDVLRRELLPI